MVAEWGGVGEVVRGCFNLVLVLVLVSGRKGKEQNTFRVGDFFFNSFSGKVIKEKRYTHTPGFLFFFFYFFKFFSIFCFVCACIMYVKMDVVGTSTF